MKTFLLAAFVATCSAFNVVGVGSRATHLLAQSVLSASPTMLHSRASPTMLHVRALQVATQKAKTPFMRSAAQPAMMSPDALAPLATLPTTTVLADDTLLFASGSIIGFVFLFAVVGTVIVNFGIRK